MNRSAQVAPLALWLLAACGGEPAQEPAQAVLAPSVAASSAQLLRVPNAVPGQYIVVLDDAAAGVAAEHVPEFASRMMARHGGSVQRTYAHALRGFVANMSEAQARALAREPSVKYIEEDALSYAPSYTQSSPAYHLDRIDQRDLPLNSGYLYYDDRTVVHAYIIDTGIRTTHGQFGGRATADYSAISDKNGANDCHGHGTHVAGTVGGYDLGVARGIRLHSVRVIGCDGTGTTSQGIAGIDWVTYNHVKPAVSNISLQYGASQALDDAIRASINAGVTYVVAANNLNSDSCLRSPSRVTEAITVGATDANDQRASFSSWGPCVDIFAPGVGILSTAYTSDSATATLNGTSMATPQVTGTVARYLQIAPNATPAAVAEQVLGNATVGKVIDPGVGSPNRLLYTDFTGAGMRHNVHYAGFGQSEGESRLFSVDVPVGHTRLDVFLGGNSATGNPDLYVRGGALPTLSTFDCSSTQAGTYESCTLRNVQPGRYFIRVQGAGAYFAVNVIAVASIPLQSGVPLPGLTGSTQKEPFFSLDVPAGMTTLRAETYGGTGDFLLGVRRDVNVPASWPYAFDCTGSTPGTPTKSCTINSPVAGTWFINLYSSWYYQSYSGVTMLATTN